MRQVEIRMAGASPFNTILFSQVTMKLSLKRTRSRARRYPSRRETQAGFGIRIKAIRQSRGWSQNDLAGRCRISRDLLGVVERGHQNFRLATLLSIAKGLETTVAELLAGIA